MESEGVIPMHQFAYRKGLGNCVALLDIVCTGQAALGRGKKIAVVRTDFSAEIDRVSHSVILFLFRFGEIVGFALNLISAFLNGRLQRVVVNGVLSGYVKMVSIVP